MQHDLIDLDFDLGKEVQLFIKTHYQTHTHRYHKNANNDRLFMSEYDSSLALHSKVFPWLPAIHEQRFIVPTTDYRR